MNFWIALSGGFLSFISPCTLPLLPLYISYITGKRVNEKASKIEVFTHSLFFLAGIGTIYYTLGFSIQLLASAFSGPLVNKIAGIGIILMGLVTTGILKIPFLLRSTHHAKVNRPVGYLSSYLIGLGFASGWTPCIGPIFASILLVQLTSSGSALLLITAFVLGFSIPFLLISLFISQSKKLLKYSEPLMKIGGIIMILIGILLFTNQLNSIVIFFNDLFKNSIFTNLG